MHLKIALLPSKRPQVEKLTLLLAIVVYMHENFENLAGFHHAVDHSIPSALAPGENLEIHENKSGLAHPKIDNEEK